MDFLKDFGVQPVLLIAQAVNFLILLYILKRFLYKPVLKVLDERKKTISDSLQNAEEIEKKLTQITAEREEQLKKASREAEEIIKDATASAGQIIAEAHEKAGTDIEGLVAKAHQSISLEKEKMRQEIRAELADLVVAGLQKVTGKVLDKKDQEEMVKETIKEL